MNFVDTIVERNLFTNKLGNRYECYFSSHGTDNVHLSVKGITRLAKHLKYLAHIVPKPL